MQHNSMRREKERPIYSTSNRHHSSTIGQFSHPLYSVCRKKNYSRIREKEKNGFFALRILQFYRSLLTPFSFAIQLIIN